PFEYDDQHILALRTMTLLLQSRLFDAVRQELGGTYSITSTPDADRFPRPQYSVRIEWTCDPARTPMLVERVFEEIERLKNSFISRDQTARIHDTLLRDYEENSQDNGYLLNEISRHYADGLAAGASPMGNLPPLISEVTGSGGQEQAHNHLSR